MDINQQYMERSLQIAGYGIGEVAPNPMVGCVIVHEEKIIGEGYHRKYGEAHAEVNAIASVSDESLLRNSTLYVTLEPCSHYGKTPPCAELIISKKIPRVVIGTLDPNPCVAGRGVRILEAAGVEVVTGILEERCLEQNKRFFTYFTKHRPFVYLKWAQTADHFMDYVRESAEQTPLTISNGTTKALNHKIRTEESAILVGYMTALLDNPHLTARNWSGNNPLRLCLDREAKLPKSHHLLDGSTPTVIFTSAVVESSSNLTYARIDFEKSVPAQILKWLRAHHINSLIVEGGQRMLQSFIDEGLWDECQIETNNVCIGSGIAAPKIAMKTTQCRYINGHKVETGTPLT